MRAGLPTGIVLVVRGGDQHDSNVGVKMEDGNFQQGTFQDRMTSTIEWAKLKARLSEEPTTPEIVLLAQLCVSLQDLKALIKEISK